jgi:hypothetical protein
LDTILEVRPTLSCEWLNLIPLSGVADAGVSADNLLEELIKIHSSSATFRQSFRSQATTQTFIDAFKSFINTISMFTELEHIVVRVIEKLCHLALSISLDDVVAVVQRQEVIMAILKPDDMF